MLYIGQQQFLMLFFVVASQINEGGDFAPVVPAGRRLEKFQDHQFGVGAIGFDFVQVGPRNRSSLRTRMARPFGLVIGIEKVMEAFVVRTVIANEPL